MEQITLEEKIEKNIRETLVHYVLSYSYATYLFAIIIGVVLDMIFHIKIFSGQAFQYIGFVIIILSSMLVYWAQTTSRKAKKEKKTNGGEFNFFKGPYKYTKNPTHIGLSLTALGFGFMIGSFFVVLLI